MTRIVVVFGAAMFLLALFAGGMGYMVLFPPAPHSVPVWAVWAWLAIGYASVGMLIYHNRLEGTYSLQRSFGRG